jgi:hypothetical protein
VGNERIEETMPDLYRLPRYRVYLLRLWEEKGAPELAGVWRFSLQDPRTGEQRGFADLETLMAFLQAVTQAALPHIQNTERKEIQ